MDVDEYGTNASEGLLYETSEGHVRNIFDCVSWTDAVYRVKGGEELVEAFWVI